MKTRQSTECLDRRTSRRRPGLRAFRKTAERMRAKDACTPTYNSGNVLDPHKAAAIAAAIRAYSRLQCASGTDGISRCTVWGGPTLADGRFMFGSKSSSSAWNRLQCRVHLLYERSATGCGKTEHATTPTVAGRIDGAVPVQCVKRHLVEHGGAAPAVPSGIERPLAFAYPPTPSLLPCPIYSKRDRSSAIAAERQQ